MTIRGLEKMVGWVLRVMCNSPDEFLAELKQRKWQPMPDHPYSDSKYQRITYAEMKQMGVAFVDDPLEAALKLCIDKVFRGLSSEDLRTVNEKVAFGVTQMGNINATIYRSKGGHYAILLNRGLMMFLNKFLKLSLTQGLPDKTKYIDKETKELLEKDGIGAVFEFIRDNYLKYGEPLGGKVKPIPEIQGKVGSLLHYGEFFLVCHELGHFFNGDFDKAFSSGLFTSPASGISKIKHPHKHKMEFLADLSGYEIYRKGCSQDEHMDEHASLMTPIVILFDAVGFLDDSENLSHPHPIRRVLNIAYHAHGKEAAYFWLSSYEGHHNSDFIQKMREFIEELDETQQAHRHIG